MSDRVTRRSVLAAGGLATAAAVTGCGGRRFDQARGSVPDKYRNRERVVFWHAYGAPYGELLDKLADRFNQSQSDIFVEPQFQGTYAETVQKVAAALLARRIPDLITVVEQGWRKLYLDEVLEPLDDYFDASFPKTVYNAHLLEEGVRKGSTWWLPLARSTPLLYFNRTIFEKAGLPNRAPATWGEWAGWMRELKGMKVKGSAVRWEAYQKLDGDWPFQAAVWQWGGSYSKGLEVHVNDAPAVAAGEWQRKLVVDGHAYMADAPHEDFSNQLIATLQSSAASLGPIREAAKKGGWELGTGGLPKKVRRGVPTGGGGLSILGDASTARKQAAFEFVKFLARPDNAALWAEQTGYLPVVPKALEEPRLAKLLESDPNYAVAVRQLRFGRKPDEVWCTVPNAFSVLGRGLQSMWSGRTPAQQVLDDVARQWERTIDRAGPGIRRRG